MFDLFFRMISQSDLRSLSFTGSLHGTETPTVGMLDLGGGSTQITFALQDEVSHVHAYIYTNICLPMLMKSCLS